MLEYFGAEFTVTPDAREITEGERYAMCFALL